MCGGSICMLQPVLPGITHRCTATVDDDHSSPEISNPTSRPVTELTLDPRRAAQPSRTVGPAILIRPHASDTRVDNTVDTLVNKVQPDQREAS